ncbi:MAG: hypothetical protein J6C94_04970 [Alistipes sp.]|nr:hypothetical protein [Alistipes sp.]
MQRNSNIYSRFALLLVAAITLLLAGCNRGEEVWMPSSRTVTIELSVSDNATRTELTATESVINELRIYAFYNDRLAGFASRGNTAMGEPFYMDLELPESGTHTVEFYAIANENELGYENGVVVLDEQMTKSELEAIRYTGAVTGTSLPMYCKTSADINVEALSSEVNTAEGHNGHFILSQKVALTLERSLAKLSFYATKIEGAATSPQIHGINYLAQGTRQYSYLFPQDEATLAAIPQRANDRILFSGVAEITGSVAANDAAARENLANYNTIFTDEYFGEVTSGATAWDTPSMDVNAGVLHVEYCLGEGQQLRHGYIFLPPILRNHHIKVCLLINSEGGIIINYTVAPWEDGNVEDLQFDYPTHSYIRESIPTTDSESTAKPSAAATMSESKPFTGYFQMTYPEHDRWTPTLLGLNGSLCTISVFDIETGQQVESFPVEASSKWYRIEVAPNVGHMEVGDEVLLAISYSAQGFETLEYMLINGSHGNYYWPYSGATAQDANYVIITMTN